MPDRSTINDSPAPEAVRNEVDATISDYIESYRRALFKFFDLDQDAGDEDQ